MAIRERTAATGTAPTGAYQVSVTLPASIVAGDLLVAFGGQTTTGGIVEPTGWTAIHEKHHGNGSHQYGMWYKVADGTEAGTTVTWSNASSSLTQAWVMHVVPFYDDGGTAWDSPPLDTFDWSEVIDTTTLTAPTITTGVNNALLVWGTSIREGVAGSASFTQSGVTELADANSAITGAVMGAIVQATAGATPTISSTSSIICTRLGGVLASFKLAAAPGGVALTGTSAGTSTTSGDLALATALSGTSAGTSTTSGELRQAIALAGSSSGTSTTSGDLTVGGGAVALDGTSAGSSTTTGALSLATLLAGTSAGASTTTGTLSLATLLTGTSAGTSTTTGALLVPRALTGTSAGTSTTTGVLAFLGLPVDRLVVAVRDAARLPTSVAPSARMPVTVRDAAELRVRIED